MLNCWIHLKYRFACVNIKIDFVHKLSYYMKRLITKTFNGVEIQMEVDYDFYIPHGYLKVIAKNLGVSERKLVNLRKGRIENPILKEDVLTELNKLISTNKK